MNTDLWTFECTSCGNFEVVAQAQTQRGTTLGTATALN
jgi:hypothetical protein